MSIRVSFERGLLDVYPSSSGLPYNAPLLSQLAQRVQCKPHCFSFVTIFNNLFISYCSSNSRIMASDGDKILVYHDKTHSMYIITNHPTVIERRHRRERLEGIRESVNRFDHHLFSPTDLKECCIQHERMPLESEPKPLYFTPYEASILDTDYEVLLDWYPELEQPNPESRANDLVWYIREYLKHCKLPEDEMSPPGSVYQESAFPI